MNTTPADKTFLKTDVLARADVTNFFDIVKSAELASKVFGRLASLPSEFAAK
jgi:hypothetical protein